MVLIYDVNNFQRTAFVRRYSSIDITYSCAIGKGHS